MQRDFQIIRATQRIFARAYNVVFIYIFTLFIKYIHLCFNAHVVVVVVGGGGGGG